MVSLRCSGRQSPSVLGFCRHNCCKPSTVLAIGANLSPTSVSLRFKNVVRLQARQSSSVVFASNTNPPDQDSLKGKSDGIDTGDAGQGPPFLTILAGAVVFFLVCWIILSAVMWLISLIFNLPSSK